MQNEQSVTSFEKTEKMLTMSEDRQMNSISLNCESRQIRMI